MNMNKRKLFSTLSFAVLFFSGAALAAGSSGSPASGSSGSPASTKKIKKLKVHTDPPMSFALHGFIDLTGFWQDQDFFFGNGQEAELPLGSGSHLSGADIRNTRLWITITGPTLDNGWSTSGRVEGDFFGGFNGTSSYSSSQATPRLRQAFFALKSPSGNTSVSVGQQWDLVFPIASVPKSDAHVAFPLGFGTGMIGWRFPGIVLHQALNSPEKGNAEWGLDVGAFSGQWDGPGSNTNFDTAGNVGFRPQLEARLAVKDHSWEAYAVGYYSSQNLENLPAGAPSHSTLNSWLGELGLAWHPGPWSLVGAVYDGKAIGQEFGSMAQFGDIADRGGYVQGGYSFTPHWGVYLSYATDRPNEGDVIQWLSYGSSGRLKGQQAGLDLLYTNGPFGAGVEWVHAILTTTTNGTDRATAVGNQLSFSGIYHF